MSRWAELFAALAGSPDTVDTMRHSVEPSSTVSQSVQSVTPPPARGSDLRPGLRVVGDGGHGFLVEGRETTSGSIVGGGIDGVFEDWARYPIPSTLLTQLTQWSEGIAHLDPDRPPADVPLRRWHQFIADARRLFEGGHVAEAARLGWGPFDLFGCDDTTPFGRVDQWGLVWFAKSSSIVSMSMSAAVIETATGAKQTYRRHVGAPGRVLVWELF